MMHELGQEDFGQRKCSVRSKEGANNTYAIFIANIVIDDAGARNRTAMVGAFSAPFFPVQSRLGGCY